MQITQSLILCALFAYCMRFHSLNDKNKLIFLHFCFYNKFYLHAKNKYYNSYNLIYLHN